MRVRNRKGATELLEANPQYVVLNPLEAKGKWRDLFGRLGFGSIDRSHV